MNHNNPSRRLSRKSGPAAGAGGRKGRAMMRAAFLLASFFVAQGAFADWVHSLELTSSRTSPDGITRFATQQEIPASGPMNPAKCPSRDLYVIGDPEDSGSDTSVLLVAMTTERIDIDINPYKCDPDGRPIVTSVSATSVGTRNVLSVMNKMCMSVLEASRATGAQLVIWDCHNGDNQKFVPNDKGELRIYGTMCVDAYSGLGNDGDRIVIWPCHGGPNQQWRLTSAGELRGINNKCLDVAGANSSLGTRLILWTCHGGLNQKWMMQ